MQAEWCLGWEKVSWLFREVSSVQGCPYRGLPLYIALAHIQLMVFNPRRACARVTVVALFVCLSVRLLPL